MILLIFLLTFTAYSAFDLKHVPRRFLERRDGGETWVVLVAGANGWGNYWSQAQVYAAYHQLSQAGIPDDRMIVWHFDDIANSRENPFPGKVYLFDPSKGAPNVYEGVPKDLTGREITPDNFMKLMRGEQMTIGSGKSLRSTKADRVFVYYSDHGGAGVIYFPMFHPMHASDLISTLKEMHEKEMFAEMVFYLDTCHSGSIFNQNLPTDINVYAATSTDPNHVAWLCDCRWMPHHHENDFPCTSNCWGKYWIYDALGAMKKGIFDTRTLWEQYLTCRNETYHDHCYYYPRCDQQSCWYGDQSIAETNELAMFEGPGVTTKERTLRPSSPKEMPTLPTRTANLGHGKVDILQVDRVPVTHAKWMSLQKRAATSNSLKAQLELQKYELMMQKTDVLWGGFALRLGLNVEEEDADIYSCWPGENVPDLVCLKRLYEAAILSCGPFNEYSARHGKLLSLACAGDVAVEEAELVLMEMCS